MIENILIWVCITIIIGLLLYGILDFYKENND